MIGVFFRIWLKVVNRLKNICLHAQSQSQIEFESNLNTPIFNISFASWRTRNEQTLEMESRTRSNSFSVTKNFFEEKTCTNQKYLISKETKKIKQSDDDGQEKQSQESINEFDLEKDSKSKQKSSNSMLMRLFRKKDQIFIVI